MSIGSGTDGGVDPLLVDDLTIDGADNGIRIKSDRSRGDLVENSVYRNVCIRDTRNPIVLTPLYTMWDAGPPRLDDLTATSPSRVASFTPATLREEPGSMPSVLARLWSGLPYAPISMGRLAFASRAR